MLFQSLLAGLCLATALEATPLRQDESLRSVVHFKRDAVLSGLDLELADCGNTLFHKRHDGDDVTIWVDNNYEEAQGPKNSISKRQSAYLWPSAHYEAALSGKNCRSSNRLDITGPTSPFTGGILAIRDWARDNNGYFLIGTNPENNYQWGPGAGGWSWRTILIGGSNSGRNARYRIAVTDPASYHFNWVGTPDIVDNCNWTHDRRREYDARWRAASVGTQRCGQTGGSGVKQAYEVVSFDQPV
ncbi:hypothetical protein CC79DRAFT_1365797 [Sarocladium strictum]